MRYKYDDKEVDLSFLLQCRRSVSADSLHPQIVCLLTFIFQSQVNFYRSQYLSASMVYSYHPFLISYVTEID